MSNSTKTITNTRIQIKRGTEAEWSTKSSFAPLEGEIILYSDLNKIKVGKKDNEGNLVLLADLPFIHVDKDEVDNFEHTHNDLYYTKSEVQSVISEKLGESIGEFTIDAEDVKFSTDLQFTKSFGKYVPDSTGSVIIPTKTNDMSLKTLLLDAFSEELNPKTTQPNLTIKASEMTSYEVGSVVEVDFELTTTTGSYTYGPATGVT